MTCFKAIRILLIALLSIVIFPVRPTIAGGPVGVWWDSSASQEKFGVIGSSTGNITTAGVVGDLRYWSGESTVSGNTLYVVGSDNASQWKLYKLDTVTGSLTSSVNLTSSLYLAGVNSSGNLIGIWWDSSASQEKFGVIDSSTGNVTTIGVIGDLRYWSGQSRVSGNTLYVIGSDNSSQWKIYKLDTVTGSLTSSVNLSSSLYLAGVNDSGSLIGIWWDDLASQEKFGVIDSSTGNITTTGVIG